MMINKRWQLQRRQLHRRRHALLPRLPFLRQPPRRFAHCHAARHGGRRQHYYSRFADTGQRTTTTSTSPFYAFPCPLLPCLPYLSLHTTPGIIYVLMVLGIFLVDSGKAPVLHFILQLPCSAGIVRLGGEEYKRLVCGGEQTSMPLHEWQHGMARHVLYSQNLTSTFSGVLCSFFL